MRIYYRETTVRRGYRLPSYMERHSPHKRDRAFSTHTVLFGYLLIIVPIIESYVLY